MEVKANVGGRDRLARALLAVLLTVMAIRSFRNGKRARGLLAGVGALVFGFNATTGYCGANDALGIDTTGGDDVVDRSVETSESGESDRSETDTHSAGGETTVEVQSIESGVTSQETRRTLTCASCGEPILPGQSRGPNEADEIVHDTCR